MLQSYTWCVACLLFALVASPPGAADTVGVSHSAREVGRTSTVQSTSGSESRLQFRLLEQLRAKQLISEEMFRRRLQGLTGQPSTESTSPALGHPSEARQLALIVGAEDYAHYAPLETAIDDARAVARLLRDRFGFDVQLLENPGRRHLLAALAGYRHTLRVGDSFVLYYAGHGIVDPVTERGYWLPVDAERDHPAHWISTDDIGDALLSLAARHALIIADACYAGSLGEAERDRSSFRNTRSAGRSRAVISSGGLEPVLDSGGGRHSVFAKALLNSLASLPSEASATTLFRQVRRQVRAVAEQTPEYATLPSAGHETGELVFRRGTVN